MTLRTTVGPYCYVIHSNFAFGVGVDLHLHRVHFLVRCCAVAVTLTSRFTQEALAGLASTENFSKVSLCKVDSTNRLGNFQPFTDRMLLHIKGF